MARKHRFPFALIAVLSWFVPCFAGAQSQLPLQWLYSPITQVTTAVYSPDGSILAVGGTGGIQLYDASTNNLIRCLEGATTANCIAFSPDSKTVAVASDSVQIWDVATGRLTLTMQAGSGVFTSIAFSPDGKRLVGAGNTTFIPPTTPPECYLYLWDASSGAYIQATEFYGQNLNELAYSPDGSTIAVHFTYGSPSIGVVNPQSLDQISVISTNLGFIAAFAFSPDSKTLAIGGSDATGAAGALQLWDVSAGTLKGSLPTSSLLVNAITYSVDGTKLADGVATNSDLQGDIEVWNVATGDLFGKLVSPTSASVGTVSFSPNGKSLAACGYSENVSSSQFGNEADVWDVLGADLVKTLPTAVYSGASNVSISPDGSTVAIGSGAQPWIGLWSAATGNMSGALKPSGWVKTVSFLQNGKLITDGGLKIEAGNSVTDGLLEVIDVATGKVAMGFPTASEVVNALAVSADGTILASGGQISSVASGPNLGVLEVWNVANGKLVETLPTSIVESVTAVALSPDGSTLAASGYGLTPLNVEYGIIELWNVWTGTLITSLDTGIYSPNALAFSPDGKFLADGGQRFVDTRLDSGLELWDLASATLLSSFPSIAGQVNVHSVRFSSNGQILFAGTDSQLDAFGLESYGLLSYYSGSVNSIAISPDDKRMVLVSGGNQLEAAANPFSVSVPVAKLTLNSTVVGSNTKTGGTVVLAQPAPAAGVSVILTSSNPKVVVPASVTIDAGASRATFPINVQTVQSQFSDVITATSGSMSKKATLTVVPTFVSSLAISPSSLSGGGSSTGAVSLNALSPAEGVKVKLQCSTVLVSVPATVFVAAGKTSATFTIKTDPVASQKVAAITAGLSGISVTATLTVNPPALYTLSLNPTAVPGGSSSTGTVSITSPAPAGGMSIALSGSSASVKVPKTIVVPAGKMTAFFKIQTKKVASPTPVQVTASLNGFSQVATLTVN